MPYPLWTAHLAALVLLVVQAPVLAASCTSGSDSPACWSAAVDGLEADLLKAAAAATRSQDRRVVNAAQKAQRLLHAAIDTECRVDGVQSAGGSRGSVSAYQTCRLEALKRLRAGGPFLLDLLRAVPASRSPGPPDDGVGPLTAPSAVTAAPPIGKGAALPEPGIIPTLPPAGEHLLSVPPPQLR